MVTGVGTAVQEPLKAKGKLAGKKFVFTGELEDFSREEAAQLVNNESGEVISAVSRNVDYVVAGQSPGSKLKKAQALGITVLNNAAFKELIYG